jgi:hypothetical protein
LDGFSSLIESIQEICSGEGTLFSILGTTAYCVTLHLKKQWSICSFIAPLVKNAGPCCISIGHWKITDYKLLRMEGHNGRILYSWKFFLLVLGIFGKKETTCISEMSLLLLQLRREGL